MQERPFDRIRGYHVGGKSLIRGTRVPSVERVRVHRARAPRLRDELAHRILRRGPWYSHVERFIWVCGTRDGIAAMPDRGYLPPFDFNCVERHSSKRRGSDSALAHSEREQLLREVDAGAQKVSETHYFALVRELALRAYSSSEVDMTKALRHVPTPGRWIGCAPLAPGQPAWG